MLIYKILLSIFRGLYYFLDILTWVIVADALLSWFMSPTHPVRNFISRFISPFVNPFRRITDRFLRSGLPIDLAPLFAMIAIYIVMQIIASFIIPYLYTLAFM